MSAARVRPRPLVIFASAAFGLGLGAWACKDPTPDPSGGAIERLLSATRRPAAPRLVEDAFDRFTAACRERDGQRLWTTFSPRLQAEVDAKAREIAATLRAEDLAEQYGTRDHVGGFDGTAYLEGAVRRQDASNPCQHVDLWRRIDTGPQGEDWIIVIEHPDGGRQGIRLAQRAETWAVDDLSRVFAPGELPSMTP